MLKCELYPEEGKSYINMKGTGYEMLEDIRTFNVNAYLTLIEHYGLDPSRPKEECLEIFIQNMKELTDTVAEELRLRVLGGDDE